MDKLYEQAIEQGRLAFHEQYCLYNDHHVTAFDAGAIWLIKFLGFDLSGLKIRKGININIG